MLARAFAPWGDVKMNFSQTRRVIVTGMIGNVLEWYDFFVYGFFATAIGQAFFPGGSGTPEDALYGGRFGLRISLGVG